MGEQAGLGPLDDVLQTAVGIAQQAAELIRHRARGEVHFKGAVDLVTDVDTAAEALIAARLHAAFPAARLGKAEGGVEAGDAAATWYVDPIDGTTNFAHGFPQFAVSLGLELAGELAVGVVADVGRREVYAAARGLGAWLLDDAGGRQRLTVSATTELSRALLATGFPYDRHTAVDCNLAEFEAFLRRAQGIRRAGSAALDLAFTARGWLDGYWEMKLQPWDLAGGVLLVREAGGLVTGYDGGPFALGARQVVASCNPRLHDQLLAVLQQVRGGQGPRD